MDQVKNIAFSSISTKSFKDNVNNVIRNNGNVDNGDKNNKYVNNVNVDDLTTKDLLSLLEKRFANEKDMKSFIADELASSLTDKSNLNYYRSIVRKHSPAFLFECLSITKQAMRDEKIKTSPAKYFVGVVKLKTAKRGGDNND